MRVFSVDNAMEKIFGKPDFEKSFVRVIFGIRVVYTPLGNGNKKIWRTDLEKEK